MFTTAAQAILNSFSTDRFIFGHSGHFSDELSAHLLDLSDTIVSEIGLEPAKKRNLAFLLVEAYQNIIRHRAGLPAHIDRGEGRSFFFFRAYPRGQDLVALNGVHRLQVPQIIAQLDAVRGLDHAELKELSARMLRGPSQGRGAGVGFIEMARRSGNDLGHLIRGLGPDHALFALAVRSADAYPHEKIIREAAALHGLVVMNDILLFYAGIMPPTARPVIASMIRDQLLPPGVDQNGPEREMAYSAACTTLDSIGTGGRSVCVVARDGDGIVLVLGKIMAPKDARELLARLDKVPMGRSRTEVDVLRNGSEVLLTITTTW